MKRIALLLALLIPTQLFAASGQPVIDGFLEPAGCAQLTSLASATALTIPAGSIKLTLIQAEGDDLRWRDDGVSPTTGVGMLLAEGVTLVYNGTPTTIKLIQTTGGGIANVCFYK